MVSDEAIGRWVDAVVVNNHFDTDGVLSVWTLLAPQQAAACRELLIAAAEAGDFDEWPALDGGLKLDAAIRALGAGTPDDAAAYATVLPWLPELIEHLDERSDLWGGEWDALMAAVADLQSGRLRAVAHGATGLLIHHAGRPEAPGGTPGPRVPARSQARTCWRSSAMSGRFDYRYERHPLRLG